MDENKQGSVLILDPQPIRLFGAKGLLEDAGFRVEAALLERIEEAPDSILSIALGTSKVSYDIAVIFWEYPTGVEVETLLTYTPALRSTKLVLVMSFDLFRDSKRVLDLLNRGVVGLIPMTVTSSTFVGSLREIIGGDGKGDGFFLPRFQPDEPAGETVRLRPREREILSLVARGKKNKEIAAELSIALPTVKARLRRIFIELGVYDRNAAALAWKKMRS